MQCFQNAQAQFATPISYAQKFMKLVPGVDVVKLFFFVTDGVAKLKKARVFVPGKCLQASLYLLGKAINVHLVWQKMVDGGAPLG